MECIRSISHERSRQRTAEVVRNKCPRASEPGADRCGCLVLFRRSAIPSASSSSLDAPRRLSADGGASKEFTTADQEQ